MSDADSELSASNTRFQCQPFKPSRPERSASRPSGYRSGHVLARTATTAEYPEEPKCEERGSRRRSDACDRQAHAASGVFVAGVDVDDRPGLVLAHVVACCR